MAKISINAANGVKSGGVTAFPSARKSAPQNQRALEDWERQALREARHHDPFAVLGPHGAGETGVLRVFRPDVDAVEAIAARAGAVTILKKSDECGLFEAPFDGGPYLLRARVGARVELGEDPYSYGPIIAEADLAAFSRGEHPALHKILGARPLLCGAVPGVLFAVWAPHAKAVSVIGDFNDWDARRHPLRKRQKSGVWEIFLPRLAEGALYKFSVLGADGVRREKADPFARRTQSPPETASIVAAALNHVWDDADWMASRARRQAANAPISVYEVHIASWRRPHGQDIDWDQAAARLPSYARALGFTHIELMPIAEHPFGGSWGYQPTGLFAPTARHGAPEGFARFIDACHRLDIGVILDWAPGHFPNDAHGLVFFDGTAQFEHADPREGAHPDWKTLIYNFGRREVKNFLVSSALYWLTEFHLDGLRVDAVASMLYRDYSRAAGQWIANIHGGRENLEAIAFLREMNDRIHRHAPGAIAIAEESTAWPGVTAPTATGGLGFDYKWNMGWMNDTLRYVARDPIYRKWRHNELTFSLVYAYSERFMLAISHDEVVHGKGALIAKSPGDEWRRRAQLRALFGYMWTHPGKKLLFMGAEFGQTREWSHERELDWGLLEDPGHAGLMLFLRDLNLLYAREPALHHDDDPHGFRWIVVDDCDNSVFAYLRLGGPDDKPLLTILNMTPLPRENYRIGAPHEGFWQEVLNSDAAIYGGSNAGNLGGAQTRPISTHGYDHALELALPPLSALIFRHEHPRDPRIDENED